MATIIHQHGRVCVERVALRDIMVSYLYMRLILGNGGPRTVLCGP